MNQAYQIKIDTFEGPLDLLLHLINQYEIDIYDIPVAEVTEQYMKYIQTMEQLELNIASEYLVMASTLLVIKSQMLLPKQKLNEEIDDYEEDPREELVQRLIKYRKFKEAAVRLEEKESNANHIYMRSPTIFKELDLKPVVVKGTTTIYDMLNAIHLMLQRKKWNEPLDTRVQKVEVPIEQRMDEILIKIKNSKKGVLFDDLFPYRSKSQIVVTFIALLELMKKNQVFCEQKDHFSELKIYYQSDSAV